MKVAYAFRRGVFYPHQGTDLPAKEYRRRFLEKVKAIGFDGMELDIGVFELPGSWEEAIRTLRQELDDAGLSCVAVRGGGGFTHPRVAAENKERIEYAIDFAAQIGAAIVNTTIGTPLVTPGSKGTFKGETVSQRSSRTAKEEDFERTARKISDVAKIAADRNIEIAIEIHQQSIVDNS